MKTSEWNCWRLWKMVNAAVSQRSQNNSFVFLIGVFNQDNKSLLYTTSIYQQIFLWQDSEVYGDIIQSNDEHLLNV